MQLCNLNKWSEAESVGHHGGLKSHVCIYSDTPLCCCIESTISRRCRRRSERKLKAKAVMCKNPHRNTLPDLFCLRSLNSFPLLAFPFPLTCSSSRNVFLTLPSQLSLIACEVINGFHLTSSPTLRQAPTNKTRAQHTNCPSEEP